MENNNEKSPSSGGIFSDLERSGGRKTDHWLIASLISVLLVLIGGGCTSLALNAAGLPNDFAFLGIWILTLLYLCLSPEDRPLLSMLKPNRTGNRPVLFLIGLLLGAGAVTLPILGAILCRSIHVSPSGESAGRILCLMAATFVQAGAEELVFRGVLYQKLRRRYIPPVLAVTINSIVFTALHLPNDGINFWGFLTLLGIAVLTSLLVLHFDSLWGAMAFHTAWNFLQSGVFGLKNSGITVDGTILQQDGAVSSGFFYDEGFGVEGSPAACLILGLLILLLLLHAKKQAAEPV